eukprot:s724_g6.t1
MLVNRASTGCRKRRLGRWCSRPGCRALPLGRGAAAGRGARQGLPSAVSGRLGRSGDELLQRGAGMFYISPPMRSSESIFLILALACSILGFADVLLSLDEIPQQIKAGCLNV